MLRPDDTLHVLLGRLVQERRRPLALLRAKPWRGLGGAHVLAVTEGLLWLAVPRLLGPADVASLPLTEVRGVSLRAGLPVRLDVELSGRRLRYTAVDDEDTARAFAAAVREQLPEP